MVLSIRTGFDFKTTYFYNKMIDKPNMVKCQYCKDGIMTRQGDGKEVKCPVCKGEGEYNAGGSLVEQPRKCFLKIIKIKVTEDGEEFDYIFVNEEGLRITATIYKNLDECINNQSNGTMGYTN